MSVARARSHTTGPGDSGQEIQRRGGELRPAFGPLEGDPFGSQLADDQREEREHDRDEHDGGRLGHPPEKAEGVDQWLGQRHGSRGRSQKAGERDADLHGGQEAIGISGQPSDPAPTFAALLEALELPLTQRHERQFAPCESCVEHDQRGDEGDVQCH